MTSSCPCGSALCSSPTRRVTHDAESEPAVPFRGSSRGGTGMKCALLVVVALIAAQAGAFARGLDIYFIDVEGGQSTLIVTQAGESLLIDAGFEGFRQRDAKRIVAAAHE